MKLLYLRYVFLTLYVLDYFSAALNIEDIVSGGPPVENGKVTGSDSDTDDEKEAEDTCSKGLLAWQRSVCAHRIYS